MSDMKNNWAASPSRRLVNLWYQAFVFWLLIAVASTMEQSLFHTVSFMVSIQFELLHWLPWAFLTPIIFWFASEYPIDRLVWRRNVMIHILLCLGVVCVLGALGVWVGPPPYRAALSQEFYQIQKESPFFAFLISSTFHLPTFWAIVGVAHALHFYQQARDKERREVELEARLAQAHLQTLRMQLNPHFLFNTLNSISSLVDINPKSAVEMIAQLSDLLRATLRASNVQEVSLREELSFLDSYLAIQMQRFGERLKVEKTIGPQTLDGSVPILILQPLMENAIIHGIEPKSSNGIIKFSAMRMGEILQLQIMDNGCGESLDSISHGIGLSNTKARLEALYGSNSHFLAEERKEGGFVVEISIPWKNALEKKSDTFIKNDHSIPDSR